MTTVKIVVNAKVGVNPDLYQALVEATTALEEALANVVADTTGWQEQTDLAETELRRICPNVQEYVRDVGHSVESVSRSVKKLKQRCFDEKVRDGLNKDTYIGDLEHHFIEKK